MRARSFVGLFALAVLDHGRRADSGPCRPYGSGSADNAAPATRADEVVAGPWALLVVGAGDAVGRP